jgi:pimeloyl-ACP methyl ester carboxylesterase
MSTFVLIPGAGGVAWYWHRVVPLLETRGHRAVAVDLPGDDPAAGLPEYAALTAAAAAGQDDVVLVAQSMGGFTAPMACGQIPARLMVMVNAMIPRPGETPGQWFEDTKTRAAQAEAATEGGYSTEFDLDTYFLHDMPADVAAAGENLERDEAEIAFGQPCTIERWPDVPTAVLAGREDRFFPLEFQRREARERLGAEVTAVPGGHLAALSRPAELAQELLRLAETR